VTRRHNVVAIVASYLALSCCASPQELRKVANIDLPGPTGQRFDFRAIDEEDHHVLFAHLGPGRLYVVDTNTNKVVKTVPGLRYYRT
jgi:DNA-binding beta-propeller fold protein YncE